MNEILCRLCLSVSVNMVCDLGKKTKILDDLSSLSIEILINKSLPTSVCPECFKTLHIFLLFRKSILDNQKTLLDVYNNGINMEDYYKSLKVDISKDIKTDLEDNYCSEPMYYEPDLPRNNRNKILEYVKDGQLNFNIEVAKENKNKNETVRNDTLSMFKNNKIEVNEKLDCVKQDTKDTGTKSDTSDSTVNLKHEMEISATVISHIKTESNVLEKGYKCLTCFICFPTRCTLINHYKAMHNNNSDIENEKFVYNLKDDCLNNSEKHDNKIEKTVETSKRPYICKICGRTFAHVYAIMRHGVAHSEYSLYCSQGCGYSTMYKGSLRDHERRHRKDYTYKCDTCGAGFFAKTWYEQHQNLHSNVKPYICDVCGKAFHFDRYLAKHRLVVHSDKVQGLKRYACQHCDVFFDTKKKYNTHLENHEGKKKYLCDLCGKQCSSGELLKYHKSSHSGDKPYSCTICNKRFFKKSNLTTHQRAHAGEKHLCITCGNYFAQQGTLRRHIRKLHPEVRQCSNEPKK